ncbi:DNA polymerase III subunit psi [Colwellia psychrerythraea]|uniref:DNA polymerase III psi subunit n=1 Tax=Colwellia psychrerythraea TaxID=28229 RepID=A0A099KFI7_COLPS|nr:DNA polymerase III subunit psi [Colwellia psychrerythraea]KGJ89529.1 DNA polymerase III psi subunit [Colwellia psychrerythraea]
MSINQHQFEQLTEMGISLWQQRTTGSQSDITLTQPEDSLVIDLQELTKKQLFNDILLASGLSIGEISHQGDHLNLGLFNWYFTKPSSVNEIQWQEQQLITPSISKISTSPALKKQLWQLLSKHNEQ